MEEYCREISYIQQKEGRLTGLLTSCLLKQDTAEKIEGTIEETGRRRTRCKQLLEDVKESRRYWKWKAETPDRTVWRTRCGSGYGPVRRQTVE
jgi:hypothetical protein